MDLAGDDPQMWACTMTAQLPQNMPILAGFAMCKRRLVEQNIAAMLPLRESSSLTPLLRKYLLECNPQPAGPGCKLRSPVQNHGFALQSHVHLRLQHGPRQLMPAGHSTKCDLVTYVWYVCCHLCCEAHRHDTQRAITAQAWPYISTVLLVLRS